MYIKAKLSGVEFRFKIAATHCCDGNSTTLVHDFSPEVPPIVNFCGDVSLVCVCRKAKFEALLGEYQAEVDVFREQEVPRNVEDIRKPVEQLSNLTQRLEGAKDEAMVRKELYSMSVDVV